MGSGCVASGVFVFGKYLVSVSSELLPPQSSYDGTLKVWELSV